MRQNPVDGTHEANNGRAMKTVHALKVCDPLRSRNHVLQGNDGNVELKGK